MQGRTEKQKRTEAKLKALLEELPAVYTRYYYSLATKSYTTKQYYIRNVLRFVTVTFGKIVDEKELAGIDALGIQRYIETIKYIGGGREICADTLHGVLSSISSFCRFLRQSGVIAENPTELIDNPKKQPKEVICLTPAEITVIESRIINGVGTEHAVKLSEKWKDRDMLLFRLPLISGMRVGALSEINIEDINLKRGCVAVTEKENKNRTFYLDDVTMAYIRRYLAFRNAFSACGERAFFISNRGTRMSVRAIELTIKKYSSGVNDKITPHKLRATYATLLYQQTHDIYKVSRALGHESTVPTQRYVHYDSTDEMENLRLMSSFLTTDV